MAVATASVPGQPPRGLVQLRGGGKVALRRGQLELQPEQHLVLRQRQRRHQHAQRPGHLRGVWKFH